MRLQKKFLLVYLQSEFCNWYAYNFVYNALSERAFHQLLRYEIPIPKCVVDDLNSNLHHQTRRPHPSAKRENPRRIRPCWSGDRRLVYELYG
jgi:hypothetical protein